MGTRYPTSTSITQGSKFSTLVYGPNQDRIKHSDSNGRATKYIGGIYEEVTQGGITQKIHYLGDFALFVGPLTQAVEDGVVNLKFIPGAK